MNVLILWNTCEPERFLTGYQPEHAPHMKESWRGEIPAEGGTLDETLLNELYAKFNADDRPNGKTAPSMSVGDLIYLDHGTPNERCYSVEKVGFRKRAWSAPTTREG